MVQPKYKFGDVVRIKISVTHSEIDYRTMLEVNGIVVSICFDPQAQHYNSPEYFYGIRINDTKKAIGITEHKIEGLVSSES